MAFVDLFNRTAASQSGDLEKIPEDASISGYKLNFE